MSIVDHWMLFTYAGLYSFEFSRHCTTPSNPSPTKFLKSRPEDVQYDSIELAIPSPVKLVTVTKPRNFSFKLLNYYLRY